jgi:ATP-dependent Lon protease
MELLELPGYLGTEKLAIAKRFLVPKQLAACGLDEDALVLSDPVLEAIIAGYTREAGVRSLERQINALVRKVARKKAENEKLKKVRVSARQIPGYLGPPRYLESPLEKKFRVGVANGLAWTEAGGDVMTIEVTTVAGKGGLDLTGKLGEVMRESGIAAMTYARKNAEAWGMNRWFYQDLDTHIHVPEGAIPKDGPSAGITMAVALVSALTGIPTRPDVAMTGEITLRGTVLPIGGLTEKVVAAKRAGVKTVIIPKANAKDLTEVPPEVKRSLEFVEVEHMNEVLAHALERPPAGSSEGDSEGPGEGARSYTH